jgi:carboxypeptidase D
MYDIRLKDKHPSCGMSWPPDLEHVTPYLRREDVITALHVNKEKRTGWQECSGSVGGAFRARNSDPSVKLLPEILQEVPILLFSGDQDLICNHIGTEEVIHNLEWNGGKGFETSPGVWAPRKAWTFDGSPAGFYQEARNLTYVLFYNASHMVPFDLPRHTRDMLDRFMGVDIADIGGVPLKSTIGGETAGPQTSVGGTPNSTLAQQEEGDRIKDAEWKAYRKSGEVALLVVAFAAAAWGFFVCRARQRRRSGGAGGILDGLAPMSGYKGVFTNDPDEETSRAFRRGANGDLEAAEFDENELDDLTSPASDGENGHVGKGKGRAIGEDFGLGDEEDDEDLGTEKRH